MAKLASSEKRIHMRFNKVFHVVVGSEIYGDSPGIARNISAGGMMIEMAEPLPIGSVVTVHFAIPNGAGEIAARAEVKHHYCFNFAIDDVPASTRGIGLRFIEFLEDTEPTFQQRMVGERILH
jgi:hypothetical protein